MFDLVLPLDQVVEGYRAMDDYRAIKKLVRPYRATRILSPPVFVQLQSVALEHGGASR